MENLPRKNNLETFQAGSLHPYGIFYTINQQSDKQEAVQRTCKEKENNENKNKKRKQNNFKRENNNKKKKQTNKTRQDTNAREYFNINCRGTHISLFS